MTIRSLAEVGVRLEEAVKALPGDGHDRNNLHDLDHHDLDPQTLYDRYEMVAIQILDSEHADYPPGALQEFLETFLHEKQLELGHVAVINPGNDP